MHLFYTPDITAETYTLSEEESKHSIRVLRLRIGDKLVLIDGKGGWYNAVIKDDNPKSCMVEIVETKKEYEKRNHYLHIAIAPTKNMNRLEWFAEKATEIGIEEISILNCINNKRTVVKNERINRVAISAIKQSYKSYLPKINDMTDFEKFIDSQNEFSGQKFIAHCYPRANSNKEKSHIKNSYTKGGDVIILIGPEGDFSPEEVKLALDKGFEEISFGTARLRTETAALYACSTIDIINA